MRISDWSSDVCSSDLLEPQGVKLSVNDLLIKALAKALIQVPKCNVSYAGDQLISYSRADISVAVSVPAGLITPIIIGADEKSVSKISTEMKELEIGRAACRERVCQYV